MKRIDLVIGAVLLVAAVGSAIGVATYTDDRLARFVVTWSTTDETVDLDPLSQTGAGEVEATLDVETRNLTRAAWVVTVGGSAARLQGVAVRVDVVSPTNETTSAEATLPPGPTASIDVPVDVELGAVPTTTAVTAANEDAARLTLNATAVSSLGVGNWTIRISVAPTAPGPLGGTEAFTIAPRVTLTSFRADLALETPEVGR